MTNYAAGHQAEKKAADYLRKQGFKIHDLNWKTKYCEIDIVAEKDKRIYLVEVKYRRTNNQGGGLDYITPSKLRQMQYAAEIWVSNNPQVEDYQLAAISINDSGIEIIDDIVL